VSNFIHILLYVILAITSVFLICLILIQRGKGGGLAGAFGGAGASSAFGTKAGDVFTRVTMIAAGVWITLNMLLVVISNRPTSARQAAQAPALNADKPEFIPNKPDNPKGGIPAGGIDRSPIMPPAAGPARNPAAPAPSPAPAPTPGGSGPAALPDEPFSAPKS